MAKGPRFTRAERGAAVHLACRLLAHEVREFPSESRPDRAYRAVVQHDGKTLCDCRGWTVKKAGQARQCKHTRELIGNRATRVVGDFLYVVQQT